MLVQDVHVLRLRGQRDVRSAVVTLHRRGEPRPAIGDGGIDQDAQHVPIERVAPGDDAGSLLAEHRITGNGVLRVALRPSRFVDQRREPVDHVELELEGRERVSVLAYDVSLVGEPPDHDAVGALDPDKVIVQGGVLPFEHRRAGREPVRRRCLAGRLRRNGRGDGEARQKEHGRRLPILPHVFLVRRLSPGSSTRSSYPTVAAGFRFGNAADAAPHSCVGCREFAMDFATVRVSK